MPSELKKMSKPEIVLHHIPSYQYGCAFFENQLKERMKFVEREVDCKMDIIPNSSDFEPSHLIEPFSISLLLSTYHLRPVRHIRVPRAECSICRLPL